MASTNPRQHEEDEDYDDFDAEDYYHPVHSSTAGRPTFDYSSHMQNLNTAQVTPSSEERWTRPSTNGRITLTEMKLDNVEPLSRKESTRHYNGKLLRWPAVLLFLLLLIGSVFLIVFQAKEVRTSALERADVYNQYQKDKDSIQDGKSSDSDLVSDDGQIGNPKSYPDKSCSMPDYQSKDNKIYAVSPNGTEVVLDLKGVNWFGMETGIGAPFGLWENTENGTTAYAIASFLERNNFNVVRLPLCVENLLDDTEPQSGIINEYKNRALNTTSYIGLVRTIVEALGYRQIGVILSMHTLTTTVSGGLWYDNSIDISEDDFLDAVDILTSNLCSDDYWNVIGIDVKNEPYDATWGSGDTDDFVLGAETIANEMLGACSNWLAFVEGIAGSGTVTLDGEEVDYYNWYGGGLQDAADTVPEFDVDNKLVWAPHYYTPAVTPQNYLYADSDYTEELDNSTLKNHIQVTMDDMFGFLLNSTDYALILGEFAGLYAKDAHPELTTQRCTDYTIEIMLEEGYAGGIMWSLNPESEYEYNPGSVEGSFYEGVLEDDWLTVNSEFLDAFLPMDEMSDLKFIPCFQDEA